MTKTLDCPCGSGLSFALCCGPLVEEGAPAASAEALMRSRYTAYVMAREAYLLTTWHPGTRPPSLNLREGKPAKWIGLEVKRHEQRDATHALVEFVARYKVDGRAQRLHEVSHFVQEGGRWFYVDGDMD